MAAPSHQPGTGAEPKQSHREINGEFLYQNENNIKTIKTAAGNSQVSFHRHWTARLCRDRRCPELQIPCMGLGAMLENNDSILFHIHNQSGG
jgi:hypothetical protein